MRNYLVIGSILVVTVIIFYGIWSVQKANLTFVDDFYVPFADIAEKLDSDLETSEQPVIISSTSLSLNKPSNEILGFGVKNDRNRAINYKVKFILTNCPERWKNDGVCKDTSTWFEYYRKEVQYTVKSNDKQANRVDVKVSYSAVPGNYEFKFVVYEGKWKEDCAGNFHPDFNTNGCSTIGQAELFLTVT